MIDDDVNFLKELAEMLKLSGYEPICVSDALKAFGLALDINPDGILLDLKMAGLSGFLLADKFSRNNFLKDIPIVAMTGYFVEDAHNILLSSCGIRYLLKKPFDYFEVITKIETALADADKEGIIRKKKKIKKYLREN